MNRRSLLTSIGIVSAAFAGCLSAQPDDDWGYSEPCDHMILSYEDLPDGARYEVEKAFEEGEYETKGELRYELAEGPNVQALKKDGAYYESRIRVEEAAYHDHRSTDWWVFGETRTLSFEETQPRHDSPVSLGIYNKREEPREVAVVIENENERLVDKWVTVEPSADDQAGYTAVPVTDEFRAYDLTVELTDGTMEEFDLRTEWDQNAYRTDAIVIGSHPKDDLVIDEDELTSIVEGGYESPERCPWQEEGIP